MTIVSDNGPAYKSYRFQLFIQSHPEAGSTCAPNTALPRPTRGGAGLRLGQYEHLFRMEIPTELALATEAESLPMLYKEVRPHEHLGFKTLMGDLPDGP